MTRFIFTVQNNPAYFDELVKNRRYRQIVNSMPFGQRPNPMQPKPVSDLELKFGVTDLRFFPPVELMYTPWAHKIAKDWFYETLDYRKVTFTSRDEQLPHKEAIRHIHAIKSTLRVDSSTKIDAMARLLTLWYTSVTEGR